MSDKKEIEEFNDHLSSMITEGLRKQIGAPRLDLVNQVSDEIENSGEKVMQREVSSLGRSFANVEKPLSSHVKTNIDVESSLIILYDIHDNLVSVFEKLPIELKERLILSDQIKDLSRSIRFLGGSVDTFDPLDHTSGLQVPESFVNAQKVIETTISCYKMGNVVDSSIKDENTILIRLEGVSSGVSYRVDGEITALYGWTGSEAIDYIHNVSGGKLSVKAFSKGRWKDISEDYEISGEVEDNFDPDESIDENEAEENNQVLEKKEFTNEEYNDDFENDDDEDDIDDFNIIDD